MDTPVDNTNKEYVSLIDGIADTHSRVNAHGQAAVLALGAILMDPASRTFLRVKCPHAYARAFAALGVSLPKDR
jgi:hypothetical protein